MQSDDINSRTIAIIRKVSIVTAKQIINLTKKILEINKHKTQTEQPRPLEELKKVKAKDLAKKGKIETLELNGIDSKALKKELKRYGMKFSIEKNLENRNNIIFLQAKDIKVMEQVFKEIAQKFTKDKSRKRKSVIERLNNFKDKVKDATGRDKVKHKHQEQSL